MTWPVQQAWLANPTVAADDCAMRVSRREKSPALVIEYTDPEEGFPGWLVIDSLAHGLCAGGMRVQPGLTRERLAGMARNMTRKMRLCGLRIDGAKSGIAYDPAAPGKHAAMARFMRAILPFIRSRYSMGPDLNVDMAELDAIGRTLGLPSVKIAVAGAQGWDLSYFARRYAILQEPVDGLPLGRLRAGYGVAVAVLAVIDYFGIPYPQASVAIQGFGTLARAAAYALAQKGVRISALADVEKCVIAENGQGLDINSLLRAEGTLLPDRVQGHGIKMAAREEIFQVPCAVLLPAAVERTVTEQVAGQLRVRAVVPGANLAVTPEAENLLSRKGTLVLPDFLAGCGGSLSMEGLFAPDEHPGPAQILAHVEQRMAGLVRRTLTRSMAEGITPTQAAWRICAEAVPQPGSRPYGTP
jgi:glutamate dehydrogenase (NAD(P)+)